MAAAALTEESSSVLERHLVSALEEWLAGEPPVAVPVESGPVEPERPAPEPVKDGPVGDGPVGDGPVGDAQVEAPRRAVAADRARPVLTLPVDDRAPLREAPPEREETPPALRETPPALVETPPAHREEPDGHRGRRTARHGAPTSPAAASPAPAELLDVLTGVARSIASLAGADWHALSGRAGHEALDLVERIERLVDGVRSRVIAAVDSDGLWALDGSRTFPAWLRQRTGTTAGAASREVREARALRDHLPLTAAALADGRITSQHVSALVREALTTQRLRAQLRDAELGEEFLVSQAREMDAGTFTKLVKAWAIAADPEAAERNWREDDAKEALTLAPTLGGYHVAGWLDDTSGQLVHTALSAHMGRKGHDDDRTPSQRRAAALVSLARQSLDAGTQGTGARVRPHITVTTPLETLRALAEAMGSAVPGPPAPPATADPAEAATDGPGPASEPDGVSHVRAEAALSAPGGPRDPGAPRATTQAPFELSPEARTWIQGWRPGDPHVISTAIDHDVVRGAQPATLEDGTPIPPGLLARLVCESGLSRVVFGAESTVLDVGREKRIFPANQVKAVIARDRHCQYPGCDEPPGFGEIHHSIWWAKDNGPTSVEHGILLCWHHHDWVHIHQVTITRAGGRWHFTDRGGRAIGSTDPPGETGPPAGDDRC